MADTQDFGLEELGLEEAIGVAIGAASMCWDNIEGAGVFDSNRASLIVDQLIQRINHAIL